MYSAYESPINYMICKYYDKGIMLQEEAIGLNVNIPNNRISKYFQQKLRESIYGVRPKNRTQNYVLKTSGEIKRFLNALTANSPPGL